MSQYYFTVLCTIFSVPGFINRNCVRNRGSSKKLMCVVKIEKKVRKQNNIIFAACLSYIVSCKI